MKHLSDKVLLGKVSGVFGVRGWIKVYSYTRPKENILDYAQWYVGNTLFKVLQKKVHGKGIVALLANIDQRDLAEKLVDADIHVLREQLPKTQTDEYYWTDLIGLEVVNLAGISLGHIENLFETGANDVLVVKGERERLIPLVFDHVVLNVDVIAKKMQVDWDSDF